MPSIKPIPDGFHTITPHIAVNGAAKAIEFYKQAFGAQEIGRHAMPDGSIMHATIKIGDSLLMLHDEFPGPGPKGPLTIGATSLTLHLYVPDVDKSFERAVKAGATVKMPVADQFWGARYGLLGDPFGYQWAIATHIADPTPAEVMEGARKAFAPTPPQGKQK